jgi:hypothetical protein
MALIIIATVAVLKSIVMSLYSKISIKKTGGNFIMRQTFLESETERLKTILNKLEKEVNYSEKLQGLINKDIFSTLEELENRLDEIEGSLDN